MPCWPGEMAMMPSCVPVTSIPEDVTSQAVSEYCPS
jgi:hypothetical protein